MNLNTKKLTVIAMAISLNFIGSFVALTLKLPIYLDSVGTILGSIIFGPQYGISIGIITSLITSTYDSYSLYFMPVQIIIGLVTGIFAKNILNSGIARKIVIAIIISVSGSIISSLIATYIFGTITSSGSSYIVQLLRSFSVPDFIAVFIIQVFTDFFDKFISLLFVCKFISLLKNKLR